MCALEGCQSCEEPCFAGASSLEHGCLPQIPRHGGRVIIDIINTLCRANLVTRFGYGVHCNKCFEGLGFHLSLEFLESIYVLHKDSVSA